MSKNIIHINENTIRKMVSEAVRLIIKESDDLGMDGDFVEDDWRSEEPSADEVSSVLSAVRERCSSCGAFFKELGDNEFGVISRDGVCADVVTLLNGLERDRIIHNTGGSVSDSGSWHAKFRIIGAMNEASFRKTIDKAEKIFNPKTLRGRIGRKVNPEQASKYDALRQKAKDMSRNDAVDAKFLAMNHPDENDAKEIKMKRKRSKKYSL